ncbi:MAG: TonB-dependent receptor, partial [Oceanicaulis sp.]|nr:TonB-dependent receptor [Oceanicaulis sp.]
WQQGFSFLPGLLGNTGIFANLTVTDSEMDIGRTVGGRSAFPLQGQSDTVYNVSLFYETDRFNARLSYNDRSDYLDSVSTSGPDFDIYWEGRSQLDFTAAYEFTDSFELFFEAKNLTNTDGVRYQGVRERVYEREAFGYTLFLGARFSY